MFAVNLQLCSGEGYCQNEPDKKSWKFIPREKVVTEMALMDKRSLYGCRILRMDDCCCRGRLI